MTRDRAKTDHFKSIPPFAECRRTGQREITVHELLRRLPVYETALLYENIKVGIIETEQELPVLVDVARVQRALSAFIENAQKTMSDGGLLTITTGTMKFNGTYIYGRIDCAGSCAFISISDTGPGMNEDSLARIFEPGYDMSGGMSLSVARHTIRQHNGSVNLDSRPGQGTTVKIYLPLLQKKPPHLETIPLPPVGMSTSLPVQDTKTF